MLRTKTCGQIRTEHLDTEVVLSGWVHSLRDHGGVTFIDLRDRYGVTQVVLNNLDSRLAREYVIQVTGTVRKRDEETYNNKLPTGEVELFAKKVKILSKSQTPPFELDDRCQVKEELRLSHRFLDLRRAKMQKHLKARSDAMLAARTYMHSKDFVDVETPLLVKSTPEGARDYVVPSRVKPGTFYALPQSPQLYKQLLMVSGVDRYYQFAKCLRDEDLRADRQPEFTQIDVEMSFVDSDDILKVGEELIATMVKEIKGFDLAVPFQRIAYADSMERFGSDKPDLRFDLELTQVTDIVAKSDFSIFQTITAKKGTVYMLNPQMEFGRNEYDAYIGYVQSVGGKGMAWMKIEDGKLDSNIVKYFSEDVQEELLAQTKDRKGSLLFIADISKKKAQEVAGKLRLKIAQDKGLIDKEQLSFAWIVDFPLFSRNEDSQRWDPEHHMFTQPKAEYLQYLEKDSFHPEKVIADCYDLVLNGVELASGSMRITDPDLQTKVMNTIGYSQEEIQEKFGFLIDAYKYGAPPHGGFAIGYDRFIALLLDQDDIREVMAFPKTKSAESLLDGCPSQIKQTQFKELKLKSLVLQ